MAAIADSKNVSSGPTHQPVRCRAEPFICVPSDRPPVAAQADLSAPCARCAPDPPRCDRLFCCGRIARATRRRAAAPRALTRPLAAALTASFALLRLFCTRICRLYTKGAILGFKRCVVATAVPCCGAVLGGVLPRRGRRLCCMPTRCTPPRHAFSARVTSRFSVQVEGEPGQPHHAHQD